MIGYTSRRETQNLLTRDRITIKKAGPQPSKNRELNTRARPREAAAEPETYSLLYPFSDADGAHDRPETKRAEHIDVIWTHQGS
ncbi:hypothetical protein VD0003_g8813 [Verticillium dahliae]|nr:hypothetical protein VD0003_g8813 [Verticillium dahliae]